MPSKRTVAVSQPRPFTLLLAEAFDITSTVGTNYQISVGLPMSYPNTDRLYPVLYVLDADMHFSTVLEATRLRGLVGEISEVIVVGIGYPLGTDFATISARRTYDFTSSDWDLSTPLGRWLERSFAGTGQRLRIGGAPDLLKFITEDLMPVVGDSYRIHDGDAALFGHSAGANFVGHALFRKPEAFGKYIAGSPCFAYNDWDVFRLEEGYAESHSDLAVTLYLGAASAEWRQLPKSAIVSGTSRMAETLKVRGYPSLQLTCEIFTGETHESVYTRIMQRGLEVCWPGAPEDAYA